MTPSNSVIVAALTPRGKRGELNFGASFDLIDQLCKAKVGAIALWTAAGEYPAFSIAERTRLVYLGAKRTRAPLLAGVGSEELETSLDLAREAMSAGAHGVLLPPPLLLSYSPEDLREHYGQFAEELGPSVPVWIVPGGSMTAGMALELVETAGFAGVVGRDVKLSTEACAMPELFVALDCARRTGDRAREATLQAQIREFQDWADRLPPLVAVKIASELRGIPMGPLPVPLAGSRQRLVDEFREWLHVWLPTTRKMGANA